MTFIHHICREIQNIENKINKSKITRTNAHHIQQAMFALC